MATHNKKENELAGGLKIVANDSTRQLQTAWENILFAPTGSYLAAVTDHLEAITNLQIEAMKAYAEITLKEVRAAMSIRDSDGLSNYVRSQSYFAKEYSDRFQSDAERFAAAAQTFVETTNKVAQAGIDRTEHAA